MSGTSYVFRAPSPYAKLTDLFNNAKKYSDVELVIAGLDAPLHLHRVILGRASNVLDALFQCKQNALGSYDESTKRIEWMFDTVKDVTYRGVLIKWLHFCYGTDIELEGSECPAAICALAHLQLTEGVYLEQQISEKMIEFARNDVELGVQLLRSCAFEYDECHRCKDGDGEDTSDGEVDEGDTNDGGGDDEDDSDCADDTEDGSCGDGGGDEDDSDSVDNTEDGSSDGEGEEDARDAEEDAISFKLARAIITYENIKSHECVKQILMELPRCYLDYVEYGEPHSEYSELNIRMEYIERNKDKLEEEEKKRIIDRIDRRQLNSSEARKLFEMNLLDIDSVFGVMRSVEKEKNRLQEVRQIMMMRMRMISSLCKNPPEDKEAALNAILATCYYTGFGRKMDKEKAISLWSDSSHRTRAKELYSDARRVTDPKKEIKLYERASILGHPGATNNLGVRYHDGTTVSEDLTLSAELFRQAADMGDSNGKKNLGIVLYKKF